MTGYSCAIVNPRDPLRIIPTPRNYISNATLTVKERIQLLDSFKHTPP